MLIALTFVLAQEVAKEATRKMIKLTYIFAKVEIKTINNSVGIATIYIKVVLTKKLKYCKSALMTSTGKFK